MNNIQKFCLTLGVGSLVVFYISIASTQVYEFTSLFKMFLMGTEYTNYIGLVAVFNMVCSAMGFYLFKD